MNKTANQLHFNKMFFTKSITEKRFWKCCLQWKSAGVRIWLFAASFKRYRSSGDRELKGAVLFYCLKEMFFKVNFQVVEVTNDVLPLTLYFSFISKIFVCVIEIIFLWSIAGECITFKETTLLYKQALSLRIIKVTFELIPFIDPFPLYCDFFSSTRKNGPS